MQLGHELVDSGRKAHVLRAQRGRGSVRVKFRGYQDLNAVHEAVEGVKVRVVSRDDRVNRSMTESARIGHLFVAPAGEFRKVSVSAEETQHIACSDLRGKGVAVGPDEGL